MALHTVLEQIGLSEKEAAVYLAALELGTSPVLRIAHKAAVKRPTAYVVLEELQGKGLVEIIPRGNTNFYQAVDPQVILEQLSHKEKILENSMPELRAILNTAVSKPKVRFYEGKQGIYQLYDSEILQQSEIFSMVNLSQFAKTYSEKEMLLLLDRMKESGLKAKELIDTSSEASWYIKEKNKRKLGDTKKLPKKFKMDVDFVVYKGTLVMISLKNLVAVVIEDTAISAAQLQLLESLFDSI